MYIASDVSQWWGYRTLTKVLKMIYININPCNMFGCRVSNSNESAKDDFVSKWVQAHIQDSNDILGKPILFTEFGKSSKSSGYSVDKRDNYFEKIYNFIFNSASNGGPCAGGLFWQLMTQGMDDLHDGNEIICDENPSTANVITQQSKKMSNLG